MTRRAKIWRVVAVLFVIANLAGGLYAALHGEMLHTAIHAALVLLGELVVWRLSPRRVAEY